MTLLEPLQHYYLFLREGYGWGIVGLTLLLVTVIVRFSKAIEVNKTRLIFGLAFGTVLQVFGLAFFLFMTFRHVFFQPYEYLQLSFSIFLLFFALLVAMYVQRYTNDEHRLDHEFVLMGLIGSMVMATIGPVVPMMGRFFWSLIL